MDLLQIQDLHPRRFLHSGAAIALSSQFDDFEHFYLPIHLPL